MRRDLRHERIELTRSALAPGLFTDFYRIGPARAEMPLVCYWGGAVSKAVYEQRRRCAPDLVLREWLAAFGADPGVPDLLVFSIPDVAPCNSSSLRSRALRTFRVEVLASCPNPRPTAVAHVGHSAGAMLATGLALDWPATRALATVGGVGMATPVLDTLERPLDELAVAAFANVDDPCADETVEFVRALHARGAQVTLRRPPGGHEFSAYAGNGSVREAFAFAAEHCAALAPFPGA